MTRPGEGPINPSEARKRADAVLAGPHGQSADHEARQKGANLNDPAHQQPPVLDAGWHETGDGWVHDHEDEETP